ncbi:MAG: ABC transporter substrate-binding protein [Bdellovibrionota bacterium]|nr:MAG: ABC transporter substrate-binding protein [Bdellovibrionota bacterium]
MKCLIYQSVLTFICGCLMATAGLADSAFRVGVIAPLSGALAEYGLAARNGIELARTQNPQLFESVRFQYEDSQWDAKSAVSAFSRLTTSWEANIVFNWGNPTTEALAPVAEQRKVPLIGMTLDPRVARGKRYVVRSTNSSADFSAALASHLRARGYRKLGVVIVENTYVQGLFDGLKRALGDEIEIKEIDRYNLGDQDFRTSIAKIRADGYDAIGVFLITGQVSNFYRQLSAQGVALPSFGTDFFESSTEIRLAGGGMNHAVYPHLGITDSFRTSYVAAFGNDYQIAYAGNAYDMAVMLGQLFNKVVPPPNADQIMTRIRSVQNRNGIGGTFSFVDSEEDGPHFHFPVQVKQVSGESIQVLTLDNKRLDGNATRD